jgi:hypothetical protein
MGQALLARAAGVVNFQHACVRFWTVLIDFKFALQISDF